MSTFRIEGCIWGTRFQEGEQLENTADQRNARFAQLMDPPLPERAIGKNVRYVDMSRQQRYRIVGGVADGVVCEVSEQRGEIRLWVKVPRRHLVRVIRELATSFIAQMRSMGLSVCLDIEYVNAVR